MDDEKIVIGALEKLARYADQTIEKACKPCGETAKMAIKLLKEKETVKPKTEDAWPSRIMVCGACGTCLFNVGGYKAKYCSECGKPVKWE